jgi:hydrogenase large subunit
MEVVDAKSSCFMFRGFEKILSGRDPRDAVHYTQRVCGVCPVSHGMASSLALEDAFGLAPTLNGRVIRNLVLGSNFIQSHVLHFYHLAAPDYVDVGKALPLSPWSPAHSGSDLVGGDLASTLVAHYVKALDIRRKAHRMGAIFGGRLPAASSFVPGGATQVVRQSDVTAFAKLLDEIRAFVDGVYIPDVLAVSDLFPDYSEIGRGCGNLLAYGVFDLNEAGSSKLLRRGRYTGGRMQGVDQAEIREHVRHSYYRDAGTNRTPSSGVTDPQPEKDGAYSWIKAPRYGGSVHEVGPLARMWVNGDYRVGISVMDRLAARALETRVVGDAMKSWLGELQPGAPVCNEGAAPSSAEGIGLTEAPRGALGHWVQISNRRLGNYQMVTPTGWNASPRDDAGKLGALEQALVGTPVKDVNNPLEALRVVHSFDPCLACSVHMVRPDEGVAARESRPRIWTGSPF